MNNRFASPSYPGFLWLGNNTLPLISYLVCKLVVFLATGHLSKPHIFWGSHWILHFMEVHVSLLTSLHHWGKIFLLKSINYSPGKANLLVRVPQGKLAMLSNVMETG